MGAAPCAWDDPAVWAVGMDLTVPPYYTRTLCAFVSDLDLINRLLIWVTSYRICHALKAELAFRAQEGTSRRVTNTP